MSGELRLPKAFLMADLLPFEPRQYDYYEDDDGEEQHEISNYETYTRKKAICLEAIKRNKPVYYFRRHRSRAYEDKAFINHHYSDELGVTARMCNRRVLVMPTKIARELYDYKNKKIDLALKKKYNTSLDSLSWTIEDEVRLANLPSIFREEN